MSMVEIVPTKLAVFRILLVITCYQVNNDYLHVIARSHTAQ